MDEATRRRLYNEDHALCLAWFEEHSGTTTTWPKPVRDDVVLVTQFKGIFKPKWMPYVLSVRSSPKGPYIDSPVTYNDDGSWSFRYAREENKGRSGDSLFTNRALQACMNDRIPVGVLYKESERSPYRVLGLAFPTRLEESYFLFESYTPQRAEDYSPEIVLDPAVGSGHALIQLAMGPRPKATVASMLDAMGNLHVQHDNENRAKRHQPLALLWAIGEARRHAARLTGWPAARERIGALIEEFGAANKDHAYLPFLALAGTDLWELTATPPRRVQSPSRRRWLNNQNPPVRGGLAQPVYDLFAESAEAATEAALFLLDTYFDDMTPAQSLQVLKATGLSDILGHPGDSESPATPHSLRRSRKGGAGRLADTALRIAIERHAVHLAVQHYRGMDYIVTEVGKPYDLRAVKEDEELHVEVKGSTRTTDDVELTRNEVLHAHEIRTDLYVVDCIDWDVQADGTISPSGGRERLWPDWQPAEATLTPTHFRHQLSPGKIVSRPSAGGTSQPRAPGIEAI
jgi:hypothetical protein